MPAPGSTMQVLDRAGEQRRIAAHESSDEPADVRPLSRGQRQRDAAWQQAAGRRRRHHQVRVRHDPHERVLHRECARPPADRRHAPGTRRRATRAPRCRRGERPTPCARPRPRSAAGRGAAAGAAAARSPPRRRRRCSPPSCRVPNPIGVPLASTSLTPSPGASSSSIRPATWPATLSLARLGSPRRAAAATASVTPGRVVAGGGDAIARLVDRDPQRVEAGTDVGDRGGGEHGDACAGHGTPRSPVKPAGSGAASASPKTRPSPSHPRRRLGPGRRAACANSGGS